MQDRVVLECLTSSRLNSNVQRWAENRELLLTRSRRIQSGIQIIENCEFHAASGVPDGVAGASLSRGGDRLIAHAHRFDPLTLSLLGELANP